LRELKWMSNDDSQDYNYNREISNIEKIKFALFALGTLSIP